MYKKIWEFQVFDELEKGKRVFALDTKNNQLYDLENEKVCQIVELTKIAKENDNRIFFYYWEENNEAVE